MKIRFEDLDEVIRKELRERIMQALVLKFKTLPRPGEEDMIKEVLTDELKVELGVKVLGYYATFAEHDVDCDLTDDDYIKIYMNTVA